MYIQQDMFGTFYEIWRPSPQGKRLTLVARYLTLDLAEAFLAGYNFKTR